MSDVGCIDSVHDGVEGAIAVYLVPGPEPVLVDPGPSTVRPRVVEALRERGLDPGDIRHICLTHIHLDHAGSTGDWVAEHPGITVHVHEDAARHLVDPERLVSSTRRTFGDAHDRLWGEPLPVPTHAIRGLRPGDPGPFRWLRALHSPGHIEQHMAYLHEGSGILLAGDSMAPKLTEVLSVRINADDKAALEEFDRFEKLALAEDIRSLVSNRVDMHFARHGSYQTTRAA